MTDEGAVKTDQAPANAGESQVLENQAGEQATKVDEPSVSERLLFESQKNKKSARDAEKKYLETKKQLEEFKNQQLQEQGKYKELYDSLREKHEGLQRTTLEREIDTGVKLFAKDSGCVDVDALLKLGNRQLLQYDEETGQVHGSEVFVEEARKNYPYLFNTQSKPVINPSTPGGVRVASQNKTYDKMSLAELHEEAKRMTKK
jgi:hypothetical protein